ncbi:hypothetical protein C2845_PM15G06460 [Panicum miliaceum]|uniref:Uncharacterized protein n=1 Tax=Panicum miliaceum TaxID=4540 RepID=A0A3L6Q8Z5_PANMI|nr:hypothetical protein C2845_PM15G06460 [Panicum miliaceum]
MARRRNGASPSRIIKLYKHMSEEQCKMIVYADSLVVQNLEIPTTKPRITAWTRNLLHQIIKQDTNRDGSFGKLKKKRKICEAVKKVLAGFTEVLGTFIQEMVAAEDSAEPSVRRSKRSRIEKKYDDEEEIEEDSEYEAEEEDYDDSSDECSLDPEDESEEEEDQDDNEASPEDKAKHEHEYQGGNKLGNADRRRSRLMLRQSPTKAVDVVKNVDEDCNPREKSPATSASVAKDDGSPWSLDSLPLDVLEEWEAKAIEMHNNAKGKLKIGIQDTPMSAVASSSKANVTVPSRIGSAQLLRTQPATASTPGPINEIPSSSKPNDIGSSRTASAQVLRTQPAAGSNPGAATEERAEGDSSVTPDYAPTPRRALKMAAELQSPYVEIAKKISFKCNNAVMMVYNVVCLCSGRPTRSCNRNAFIINYLFNYAILGDMVESVKPRGKLKNTIAEIGICVLNDKKTRSATRFVMPLYVSIFFPVLQKLVKEDEHSGALLFDCAKFAQQ